MGVGGGFVGLGVGRVGWCCHCWAVGLVESLDLGKVRS